MAEDACITNEELIFNCGRKRSSLIECNETSSFTLLRESIINYVENRHTRIYVPEKYKRQKSKGRLYQQFSPTVSSKVDVQFLDQKNDNSPDYLVRAFSIPSERRDKPKDQNLLYKSSNSNQYSAQDQVGSSMVKTHEYSHEETSVPQDKFERELNDEENKFEEEELNISNPKLEKCQVVEENGLRLARRNSAENIFENCSTYSISYANVALAKQNSTSSVKENLNSIKIPSYDSKTSIFYETDNTINSCQEEECMIEGRRFDDQVSLCDSFFTHVINGDYKPVSEQSTNSRLKHNLKLSNGKQTLSEKEGKKETDISNLKPNDAQNELVNNSKSLNNSQKIKKRIRKKNRKKSLEAPVYECPKCGVTYHVMPSMGNDGIRCLQCDFWTSVDPVFLKQERQAWNTCRIC